MLGIVLALGMGLSGCVTGMPLSNQTPFNAATLTDATKSFKVSKMLKADDLAKRMRSEGMTEILFVEEKYNGFGLVSVIYYGR
jgi:hypothetical protein